MTYYVFECRPPYNRAVCKAESEKQARGQINGFDRAARLVLATEWGREAFNYDEKGKKGALSDEW